MQNMISRIFPQLFFIVLGVFIIMSTYLHVSSGRGLYVDPRLIPMLSASIMVVLSLVSLVTAVLNESGGKVDGSVSDEPGPETGSYKKLLMVFIGMASWVIATPVLGFALASLLVCAAMMVTFGCRDYVRVAWGSVLVVMVLYLVFVVLLKIPMPSGLLL